MPMLSHTRRVSPSTLRTPAEPRRGPSEDIEEGLSQPFWRLALPGLLEARYGRDGLEAMKRHMIRTGWFSLLTMNVFLVADWMMAPDAFWFALKIRVGVFTPLTALILWAAGPCLPWFRPKAQAHILSSTAMLICWGVGWALAMIIQRTQSPWGVFYHAGFIVLIVWGNLVQNSFRYAVVFSAGILWVVASGMFKDPDYPPDLRLSLLVMLVGATLFTLMASHVVEKARRQRYLLLMRERELVQDLEHLHQQWVEVSRRDALTGLANRRHLQEALERLWEPSTRPAQPVAVLMMDVDHFKAYNDRYGHPAGDQCLQWVANAMVRALASCPQALVARFGGEEFVAVLPGTSWPQALQAAESVRAGIEALHMRHEASGTHDRVTLSVGVAVIVPGDSLMKPSQWLSAADRALYKAKRQGRNRVGCEGGTAPVA